MTDTEHPATFSARLRMQTRPLHGRVERAGIMIDLLRGRLERWRYCLLLRNLLPIYQVLDTGAGTGHARAGYTFPIEALRRSAAIEADLDCLYGTNWPSLPVASSTSAYVAHLRRLQQDAPLHLIAHGYLRHLGDLNGGQTLRSLVVRMFSLPPGQGVSFYDFGDADTVARLAGQYRAALDALPIDEATATAFVAEAESGYAAHERLFVELAGVPAPGLGETVTDRPQRR